MDAPRVSIIVPCYNLGRFLNEAIESVLAQTFQDFEIVVVDDGSTEPETRRLLADYRRPKTSVVHSENRGLPAAKNLGIARTTGVYICALDADDRLEPTMLEKSTAVLDANPSVAFVSHWLRTFGDEEREWKPEQCDLAMLLDMNTVNGAALVRRTAVEVVGGYDETMRDGCEDWDLWISLLERGLHGTIIPEVLFQYRRRADSLSRVMLKGDGHPRLYRRLVEKHRDAYRRHLAALLARREEGIASLRRHVHDLDLEYARWVRPEIAKHRDDVATLTRKVDREGMRGRLIQRDAELASARQAAGALELQLGEARQEAERGRAAAGALERERDEARREAERGRAAAGALERERDEARREAERLRTDAAALEAGLGNALREVDALRSSASWRVTAPLRVLWSCLSWLTGGGR